MAELVDALDLGSSGATRGSSTLPSRTKVIWLARSINQCCAKTVCGSANSVATHRSLRGRVTGGRVSRGRVSIVDLLWPFV